MGYEHMPSDSPGTTWFVNLLHDKTSLFDKVEGSGEGEYLIKTGEEKTFQLAEVPLKKTAAQGL